MAETFVDVSLGQLIDLNTRLFNAEVDVRDLKEQLADMEDERDQALLTIDRMIAGIDEAIERA